MNILWRNKLEIINNHLLYYPTFNNVTYLWSFGSLAGLCLVIQIITGIFLAMHYSTHISLSFSSIEHILRDVNYGWMIRYIHANGASMFFILIYIHIGWGLYYASYKEPREYLWFSGIIIFFLLMGTGFMGYVLPWGQMSFWGATVITNLVTAIPYIGEHIAYWLWGGFSVDNATLNRFFSLHYLLPFIVVGLVILHLILLHDHGSTNKDNFLYSSDKISFYPYFFKKDLFSFLCFILLFSIFVFFYPNILGHSDNYIEANPMVTPVHIVPEWYFLPFYAILRSIPSKLFGVILMVLAILILVILPYINKSKFNNIYFWVFHVQFFWLFIINFFLLGWIGSQPVEYPYNIIGAFCSFFYFMYFIVIIPFIVFLEEKLLSL